MNKIIRFYNQNKYLVWIVILVIIATIAIIQILNTFAENKKIDRNNASNEILGDIKINSNYSVITGQEVNQNLKEIIDEFINLCNNKQINNAYEIISDECKKVLYPTLEDFTTNYYNKIFNSKKTYLCQSWITKNDSYTFKIDFVQDMLATGTPSKTSITDYYTIINENGGYKLNINKFVGMENLDVSKTYNNIAINIKSKEIYMNYEIYDIEVINNTQNTVILGDLQDTDNIYIEDEDKKQYLWYSHEILEENITISRGIKKGISIKFNKPYQADSEATKIVFTNVVEGKEIKNIEIEI